MRKSSLIVVGLLAAWSIEANAGELYYQEQFRSPFVSTQTRGEVRAATVQALGARQIAFGDVDVHASTPSQGGRTRAEVRQETRQALADRAVAFGDVVQPPAATGVSVRTREEVRAEFTRAMMADARIQLHDLYAN